MFNNEKGFTLIELLVVIAVIGILSTVVLVSLAGVREDARDSRRMSDLNQINLAMELYNTATGTYINSDAGANDISAIGDYLAVVPHDPTDSGSYQYTWLEGTTAYYCVYALLEGTDSTTYYCASNKGTALEATNTIPDINDCCNFDVTD
ncbi:MAG: type II secretion system protein [Candidatus Paceibacterota bacterium]|jgi:prepilin-type N-terminal cleavage/methylation domain-containing protein